MLKIPSYLNQQLRRIAPVAVLMGFLFFFSIEGFAKTGEDPETSFDEILIFMNVQGAGNTQIPGAISNETAYLSVTDVFDFLKIRNTANQSMDSIYGFYIQPQAVFNIDRKAGKITYQGKMFPVPAAAFIQTTTCLYLRCDYFAQVFGLQCKFNFRSLSVIVSSDIELPVIREMRQEAMRSNLGRLKGEERADTIIGRSYPLFKMGMADWTVIHTKDRLQPVADTRLNLGVGGVVLGGETSAYLNYQSNTAFREREQYYQWRFVDNDNAALRQIMAGKLYTPTISSIYSPVVGLQFTNAPTTYRRSFGTYTLTYFIEAGWIAELYVNNTLVDYAKAEVSGPGHFQVPLVYGNSLVKIKFYSPWGEERTSEQNIQIPFNFLPKHEFEYSVTGGMVEDSVHSRLGRVSANYGLGARFTIGGGLEYLSSVNPGRFIPFANASFRASANLLFSGEYAYGVRSKWIGSYHLPSDLQVELNYTRYTRGQKAINNSFLEERKAIVSFPFRSKKFVLFSRLSVYQVVLPNLKYANTKYTTIEGLLSGVLFGVNTNITTYGLLTDQEAPYVYSNIASTFRLPGKLMCTPQIQYEYNNHRVIDVKAELGKYISTRGYVNMYYENNYKSGFSSIGLGLRYDFSFAITGFSITHGNHHSGNTVQSASGSLIGGLPNGGVALSNRNSVGKGVLSVVSYLDINGNGIRDGGEPAVQGVNVSINGGRVRANKKDSSLLVTDLEAYVTYTIKLTEAFQNVAWHIRNKVIKIVVDPNQVREIDIPVDVDNEVAGSVVLQTNGEAKPLSRIKISFYRGDFSFAGEVMTEPDGTFSYSALGPGNYTAQINSAQLEKLGLVAKPWSLPFTISENRDGDFVDGLKFVLRPK